MSVTVLSGRVNVSVNVPPVGPPVIEMPWVAEMDSRMPESRSSPSCGTVAGISRLDRREDGEIRVSRRPDLLEEARDLDRMNREDVPRRLQADVGRRR